jgi:hypothetical protein
LSQASQDDDFVQGDDSVQELHFGAGCSGVQAFSSVGQALSCFWQGGVHFCLLHFDDAVFSHFGHVPQLAGFKFLQQNAFADTVDSDIANTNPVVNNVFLIISPFEHL